MESVASRGRQRGSGKIVFEEVNKGADFPDLRQVLVLSKPDWLRIQDEMNQVDREKKRMIEELKQREALHLQSVEVVKQWSDTFAGQRQKQLEAKKIRDEIEEKKWEQIDKEEAEYQEKKRREAIEKAKTQLFYQTHRVRGLHGALLLSEVLKEREAQIELKQSIKSASEDVDKRFTDMQKKKDEEALKQEQEAGLQKKLERQTIAEDLKQKIKEKELVREREKMEEKKDGENMQRLQEQYQWEQRMEKERQAEQKRGLMQAHLENLSNRDVLKAAEAQKQEAEEQQRKLYLTAKEKMRKLRKDRETELLREAQRCKEAIMDKLTVTQQEQEVSEEQRIALAVAEQDVRQAQLQWEEEQRKASMLQSIAEHRELMRREKVQKEKEAKQIAHEALEARKEADKIFSEKQELKAQQIKEDKRQLKDFNVGQMAQKGARRQQRKREEHEFEEKKAELEAEEDLRFRQYSQQVIKTAMEAQLNIFPLEKAAREGMGGGSADAVSGGAAPIYLVQDQTGAQMPQYVTGNTQSIKNLNEAVDFEDGKKRLGFTWS